MVGSSALGNIDSGGISSSEAEFPTALACSAFLVAFIKSWLALGVLDASIIFIGTLLLDTINWVSNSLLFSLLLLVLGGGSDTVILDEADHIVSGIGVFSSLEAIFPAVLSCVASAVTEFKSFNTSSILFTSLFLSFTVLFDAFLRRFRLKNYSSFCQTSISSRTFSNISCSLVFFTSKAEFPACLLSSAFALALLKSRNTLGVFLACSPLVRAFLLNAFLRVSNNCNSFLNLVKAIVVNNALPESTCRRISLLGNAVGPACLVVIALVFTILKSSEASWIL